MRLARVIGTALTAVALTAGVAHAGPLDGVALIDTHTTEDGAYRTESQCMAVLGTSTRFNYVTYSVRASADAYGPSVPLSTVVSCVVYNLATNRVYGVVAGGLPGPHAEAVAQVEVPTSAVVGVCTEAGANYVDGHGIGLDGHCPD